MKIATLTWYSGNNYGSTMQSYALQKVLQGMGHSSEIIAYSPAFFEKWKLKFQNHSVKATLDYKINEAYLKFLQKGVSTDNVALFDEFRREYQAFSSPVSSAKQLRTLASEYDAVICGSDQIWNPFYYDPVYFLDFVADRAKRIAYAPSFGVTEVPPFAQRRMADSLDLIDNLSVREKQGADIIYKLVHRKAQVVADPALLLPASEWKKIGRMPGTAPDKPYVVCYFLRKNEEYHRTVKRIAEKNGLDIVNIPMVTGDFERKETIRDTVGPREWVALLENAAMVITDSFHCTAFSIMFNKEFGTFRAFSETNIRSQNSRIDNLLQITGLENCVITLEANDVHHRTGQEATGAQEKLGVFVQSSRKWLENALSRADQIE